MPGQFSHGYRDARSSISGFESVADPAFHSQLDLSMSDSIDPILDGPAALAGLTAAEDDSHLDPFTMQDQDPTDNIIQTPPFPEMPRSDQNLAISLPSGYDTDPNPWNLYQVQEAMPQQRIQYIQSPINSRKRARPSELDLGYASQEQTTPSFSSSPGQQMQQIDPSFDQPSFLYSGVLSHDDVASSNVPRQRTPQLHPCYEDGQPGPSSTTQADRTVRSRARGGVQRPPRNQERKHACEHCLPGEKVFKTVNDLDRHLKTVHGIIKPGERVWQCCVSGCTVATKVWPRLDNFKQHVDRMHGKSRVNEAEGMCVPYDPALHLTTESCRNTKTVLRGRRTSQDISSNLSLDEVLPSTDNAHPPAAFGPPQSQYTRTQAFRHFGAPQGLITCTTMGGNTSMTMNCPQSTNMSSKGGNAQTFLAPSQILHHSTGLGMPGQRSTARTVAAPETMIRERMEIQQQDNATSQPAFVQTSSADFALIGGGLGDNAQSLTSDPAGLTVSGFGVLDVVQSLGSRNGRRHGIDLEDDTKMFEESLTAAQRERFQSLMQRFQPGPSVTRGRSKSVSSKPSARGKKADREQTKSSFRCCEVVIEKGVEQRCNKTFAKQSELNKHGNRHRRKYGCTFDQCYKRFGTKWEWKRHEHNQHIQLDSWRCYRGSCVKACQQLFASKEAFVGHLEARKVTGVDVEVEAQASHLSKKWLGSWWCGFCREVIESKVKFGPEMDKERNEHVADHIDGKSPPKSDMWDWIELAGGGKTKREMKNEEQDGSLRNNSRDSNDAHNSAKSLRRTLDEGDDSSSDDELESPTELDETTSGPQPTPLNNNNRSRAEYGSMSMEIPQQRGNSSTTGPQLHLISPSGETSALSADERSNSFRNNTWLDVRQNNYARQPVMICCDCSNQIAIRLAGALCPNCHHHYCPNCGPSVSPHRHQLQRTQQTHQPMPQNLTDDDPPDNMDLDDMGYPGYG